MWAVIFIIIVVGVGGYLFYLRSRKMLREAKGYERGLKMVPLLIHLPPLSDDIEGGSRDARDVTEENISRAQIMYNIIASTAQQGFKSKFYGQRHISFEIIASKGVVDYYTAVPVALVSVIEQAVVSAYPTARLEEVAEHNIFSQVGKLQGTMGGELNLKEDFAFPIATFQDLKRDAMQSLLNAFSTLGEDDGAGIQILLRPANKNWTNKAVSTAQKKKKDKGKKKGAALVGSYAAQIISAPLKAPEGSEDKKPEDKQLSNLEQAVVDAIEEKTRHPGYEVLIRLIVSSNTPQRSQTVLSNITASFSLFDAPGKNGFKFTAAKDAESFTTAYILRFFPPEVNQNILNSVELSTIFHFPDQKSIPTSQLQRQASKQVDGPQNMKKEGQLLGHNMFRGLKKEIWLAPKDRQRHLYIIGQTGTGKSVLLENLALQDMLDGRGFAFIDPHGDTAEALLSMVPKERVEDVIYFSPADMDFPLGLNFFEHENPDQQDFLIQEAINMLYKLYDPQRQGIIGPRYEHLFRNAAQTIMADPEGGSFIDIPKLFNDRAYVNQKLKHVKDQTVRDFWLKEMLDSSRSNEFGEVKSWFVSKFGAFLSNTMMRNIIGQTKSSFDLRDIMDNRKILLVNLSKGRTGDLNSKLLGIIFVMKFQAAAMSRANVPEDQREDFSLYVDEFQNFSTESFATILAEARKYHLNLIVANQYIGQLTEDVRDAVFGNVGSIISLRASATDADFLVKTFSPIFDSEDIVKLPNYNAIVRLMIQGVPSQPFSMATLPPLGRPNPKLLAALKQLSAAKYGRPRAVVEDEIFGRLKTQAPAGVGTGGQPGFGQAPTGGLRPPAGSRPPAGASSFLDDWLAKRKSAPTGPPTPTFSSTPGGPAARPGDFSSPVGPTPPQPTFSRTEAASSPLAPKPAFVPTASTQPQPASPVLNTSPTMSPSSNTAPVPEPNTALKPEPPMPPTAPPTEPSGPATPLTATPVLKAEDTPSTVSLADLEKTEGLTGEVSIGSGADEPVRVESDQQEEEIYIDKDGNMHYNNGQPK